METQAHAALDIIRELYDYPDKFTETALGCVTSGMDARTHDWFKKYPNGCFVTEIRFSAEYISSNPAECFVKAMLTDASMCEGRGRDIFRGVPQDKRESFLKEKIIPEYITPKDIRLTSPDFKVFSELFNDYARKNGIPSDKREKGFFKKLSAELPKADIIEIGGNDENDHLYYVTSGDMVYIINFGEWKK